MARLAWTAGVGGVANCNGLGAAAQPLMCSKQQQKQLLQRWGQMVGLACQRVLLGYMAQTAHCAALLVHIASVSHDSKLHAATSGTHVYSNCVSVWFECSTPCSSMAVCAASVLVAYTAVAVEHSFVLLQLVLLLSFHVPISVCVCQSRGEKIASVLM